MANPSAPPFPSVQTGQSIPGNWKAGELPPLAHISYQNLYTSDPVTEPSAPPVPAVRTKQCVPKNRKYPEKDSRAGVRLCGDEPGQLKIRVSPQGGELLTLAAEPHISHQNLYTERSILLMAAPPDHTAGGPPDKKSSLKENILRGSTNDSRVVENFEKALKCYVSDLPFCANALQRHISELHIVADSLDKTHKGTRIARITGGTTGAVGGVAAVAGVLLAPATMGLSLAVAAVGVGVAAAGGVTGASAAITQKVKDNQVRKKVESILKDYQKEMNDIEGYLNNINTEMGTLNSVNVKSAKTVKLVEIAHGTSGALSVMNRSSGVIQGFALGMDLFFNEKDSQKLKKESKTKFAQQIREVAEQIQAGLTQLLDMRDKLLSEGI